MGYFDDLPKLQSNPSTSSGGFFSDLPKPPPPETTLEKTGRVVKNVLELPKAGVEAGLSLLTSGPAWMAGAAAGALGALTGDPKKMKEWEQKTTEALTYEPRTEGGRAAVEVAGVPFKLLDEKLSKVDEWVTQQTGSPELGWSAKKGAEALLFGLGGKAGKFAAPFIKDRMGLSDLAYRKGDILRDTVLADKEIADWKAAEGVKVIQQDKVLGPEPPIKGWEPWQKPVQAAPVEPSPIFSPLERERAKWTNQYYHGDNPPTAAPEAPLASPELPPSPRRVLDPSLAEAARINRERFGSRPDSPPIPEVDRIAEAMKEVESGGNYDAVAKDQGRGAYQFMPETWKDWSNQYLKETGGDTSKPLEMTPANQDAVAKWRIQKLLDQGYDHKQIASIWNSGSPNWEGKKGVNKYGVAYDVPAHVEKVDRAYRKLSGEDAQFIKANEANPAKLVEESRPQAEELGVTPVQYVENRMQNIMAETGMDYGELSKKAAELPDEPRKVDPLATAIDSARPAEVPAIEPAKVLNPTQTRMLTSKVFRTPDVVEQTLQSLREQGYDIPPASIKPVGVKGNRYRIQFIEAEAPFSKDVVDWLKGEEGTLYVGNIRSDLSKLKEKFARPKEDDLIVPPGINLEFADPLVEARFKELSNFPQKDLIDRAGEWLQRFAHDATEHHKFLNTRNPVEARVAEAFRQAEAALDMSTEFSRRYIQRVVGDLSPRQYDSFRRRVVLADVVRQAESGEINPNGPLHFGFQNLEAVKAELGKLDQIAASNPKIAKALQMREQFMNELLNKAIDSGVLPEELRGSRNYFHRETAKYVALEKLANPQKKRTGKVADFYTDYVEAEHRVVSSMLYQIEQKKLFQKISQESILDKLKAEYGEAWREHIPEGYTEFQPPYNMRAAQLTDAVMEKLVDETLQAADPKLSLSDPWVIPKNVAKEVEWRARRNPMEGVVQRTARYLTGKWKQNALYNPLHAIKYTLNNLSGDIDVVMAYSPKIISQYATQAGKDVAAWMRNKELPEHLRLELEDGFRKGIINSGQTRIEIPEAAVQLGLDQIVGRDVGTFRKIAKAYANATEGMNTWRENTLRLAAYRYFKDKVKAGERPYGASRAVELDALLPEDRAAKLTRDLLGDYGNISVTGQWLRQKAVPFWSWLEINTPRYFRMLANMRREGGMDVAGRVGAVGLKKIATNYLKFAVTANALSGAVQLWNHTMYPELSKAFEAEGQRNQQHIILGTHADGSAITYRFQGALSDVMDWIGMPNYLADFAEVLREGQGAVLDLAEKAPKAFFKKILDASMPIQKGALEVVIGQSLFPDPTSPRPIRDRAEHAAGIFGMKKLYSELAGKPSSGLGELGSNLLGFYSTDLGQNSYFQTRDLVKKFADKIGYDIPSGGIPSDKSNAIYYYKRAMALGDREAAKKYLKEYVELGGTDAGYKRSIRATHPLGGLPKKYWGAFIKDLKPEDRKVVTDGLKWYQTTYLAK